MGKCLQKQLAVAMRVSLWLGVGNGRYWLRLRGIRPLLMGKAGGAAGRLAAAGRGFALAEDLSTAGDFVLYHNLISRSLAIVNDMPAMCFCTFV